MTNLIALESGTELVGDYRIERVLGAGGFGITYLATETALDRSVTIKEYFPSDFAVRQLNLEAVPRSSDCSGDYRWGLDRFIEEAQTLAKFTHPNIVRVYRYFRANNTGYMVLHFEEGQSLKSWLKGLNRAPRQKELDKIVAPLLDALELIHKADFLHRDIAPDNIIIRKDGAPVLIDFGSARGEIASHSKTVSALVKPGYSPYEQYAETSRQQGPWTDIYALGATLYHAITGKRPADSPSRMVKDEYVPAREAALSSYRAGFLRAIDKALALQIEARPQSIAAWRGDLLAPDPAKAGWLAKTFAGDKPDGAPAAPADAPKAQPAKKAQAVASPPPPDAPGPKGGMLDFLDGLKKKPEAAPAAAAEAVKPAEAAKAPKAKGKSSEGAAADAAPKASSGPQGTMKLEDPPKPIELPRILKKQKSQDAIDTPKTKRDAKDRKVEAKDKRKPPSPRPVRTGASRWRPILFKLMVGAGVASAAVAFQDRLPSSAPAKTSAIITGANRQTASAAPAIEIVKPLLELRGHSGPVTGTAFSEDGASLITAGEDSTLKVWNTANGSIVRTILLDHGAATALAVSGSRALTSHRTGEVVLWDWQQGTRIATFKRNDAEVWSIAFAGSADRFAASSHDWKVTLWDTNTPGQPLQVIDAHENAAQAVAFAQSEQGPLLVSGSADKTVKLWNLDTFDRMRTYRGHRDFVSAVAFAPDAKKRFASASLDGNIRIWSTRSNRLMQRLYGHRARVTALAFSPDGELLASSAADGQLRVWNVARGRTVKTIVGHSGGLSSAAFAPDGERIASAGEDGVVKIWATPKPATN